MVNDIAEGLFQIFGDGQIMGLFLIGFFVVLLIMMRANLATILTVILPLVLTFTLAPKLTNFVSIEPWILPVLFLAFGLIAAFVILINSLRN